MIGTTIKDIILEERYLRVFVAISTICFLVGSCSYLNKQFNLPNDNPIEESIELIIQTQSGVQIDLTPQSPEP